METKLNRPRRTIKREVSYSGIGIHTGEEVSLTLRPANVGSGIVFQRGSASVLADLDHVCDTSRSTSIGDQGCVVYTVEHLLAAVKAFCIDDLQVHISSIEPPAGNGGAAVFTDLIAQAGILEREEKVPIYFLKEPVFWDRDSVQIVALPSLSWQISYVLNYEECSALKSQFYSLEVTEENFKRDIAPCRTFAHYDDLLPLMNQGLIKGGSLDNAVVIKDGAALSKGGLFFADEMVRHKILDLVGDLSLMGVDFRAHVIAIRSGHEANVAFAKLLKEKLV